MIQFWLINQHGFHASFESEILRIEVGMSRASHHQSFTEVHAIVGICNGQKQVPRTTKYPQKMEEGLIFV